MTNPARKAQICQFWYLSLTLRGFPTRLCLLLNRQLSGLGVAELASLLLIPNTLEEIFVSGVVNPTAVFKLLPFSDRVLGEGWQ